MKYLGKNSVVPFCLALLCPVSAWANVAKTNETLVVKPYAADFQKLKEGANLSGEEPFTGIGNLHYSGQGAPQNDQEAFKLYCASARQQYAPAQNDLGVLYYRGTGVEKDLKEAFKWFFLAAKQDYPNAQYNLGRMYLDGMGVPQNDQEAFKWFSLAAKQNDPDGENEDFGRVE